MAAAADAERARWREAWEDELPALGARADAALAEIERGFELPSVVLDARPAASAWTSAEILAHVVLANRYLLRLADTLARRSRRRLERGDPFPARPPELESIARRVAELRPWPHPAHMDPQAAGAPVEMVAELVIQRRAARDLLASLPPGAGTLASASTSWLGQRLDVYGVVELAAAHARRHAARLGAARPPR